MFNIEHCEILLLDIMYDAKNVRFKVYNLYLIYLCYTCKQYDSVNQIYQIVLCTYVVYYWSMYI